jgi:very-short-patch-repair endonuclease
MSRRKIIPYKPYLKILARHLRNNSTQAEIKLWMELKGKRIHGFDFHRQKPIDQYILDFFCHELMLGIEVDGYSHEIEDIQKKDAIKEARLNELGIHVMRFTDDQIIKDMGNVLREIDDFVERKMRNS